MGVHGVAGGEEGASVWHLLGDHRHVGTFKNSAQTGLGEEV
jgi:hypothetical protein